MEVIQEEEVRVRKWRSQPGESYSEGGGQSQEVEVKMRWQSVSQEVEVR